MLAGVLALSALAAAAPHTATCARQSSAGFPGAFTRPANLVVGPLAMIGAGRPTSDETVRRFGGNKFPVLVRAGHSVTLTVISPGASLFYANPGGGVLTETRVRDGHRAITFRACSARRAQSDADGDPVTFWSGFVVVDGPRCVRLRAVIDRRRAPRRAHIALGRRC